MALRIDCAISLRKNDHFHYVFYDLSLHDNTDISRPQDHFRQVLGYFKVRKKLKNYQLHEIGHRNSAKNKAEIS
jgi:hypothetical protein